MSKFFIPQKKKQLRRTLRLYALTGVLCLFSVLVFGQADSINSNANSHNELDAVKLGLFSGGYSSGFVQLSWKTLAEKDMSHFEIERSVDGIDFRQIGKVYSTSTGNSVNDYTFLDILAEKGSYFYRLVMIDKDGNITYSKAITISVEVKGISLLLVYPNPFSKRVQVKIECQNAEQITIRIIDNTGNPVRTQLADVQKGDNYITVTKVDDLPSGIYYLEVIARERRMRTKLMKQ